MRIIEAVNSPGKGVGTGDDRFGYDAAAGTAWVIDGSTDVGGRRIMSREESDAAWLAETLSNTFAAHGPAPDETGQAYLARAISMVADKAQDEAREDLHTAPRYALPSGAGVWMRQLSDEAVEVLAIGDCICLVACDGTVKTIGYAEKPDKEANGARKLLKLSPAQRLAALQAQRARQNTPDGYWVFGLFPQAAEHAQRVVFKPKPGTVVLLMSDGFYRLVSPYQTYSAEALVERARSVGLATLLEDLRGLEQSEEDNATIGRLKTSDDACALMIAFDQAV